MSKLSVVITAWNEEARLGRTLDSVTWADEIIVIDSSSTDKTTQIARQYTKMVFVQPNYPMLNINKNYGFKQATGDWILSLDADEVISSDLAHEIKDKLKKDSPIVGYWIFRKNIIFGKWIKHGLWWPDEQLRLFRKGSGKFPAKHVHEKIRVDGPTDKLKEPFIHYNYDRVSQYLRKLDTIYTESEVQNLQAAGYQVTVFDAVRFPISDFLKVYFAQGGFKDGLHGLVLALLQAFYSLIVFAKLWESRGFPDREVPLVGLGRELRNIKKDLDYWYLSAQLESRVTFWRRLWFRFKRRLTRLP